jgi:hypothetical protein
MRLGTKRAGRDRIHQSSGFSCQFASGQQENDDQFNLEMFLITLGEFPKALSSLRCTVVAPLKRHYDIGEQSAQNGSWAERLN